MRKKGSLLLCVLACITFALLGCAPKTDAPEAGGMDISGTYIGKETYIVQNEETGIPDALTFDWTWTLTRTGEDMYTVAFEHEATPEVGKIAAMDAVKTSIDRVPLMDGAIGIPNYVYLHFEEKDGQMLAYGTFNVLQSTGAVDVRVISLMRTDQKAD